MIAISMFVNSIGKIVPEPAALAVIFLMHKGKELTPFLVNLLHLVGFSRKKFFIMTEVSFFGGVFSGY